MSVVKNNRSTESDAPFSNPKKEYLPSQAGIPY